MASPVDQRFQREGDEVSEAKSFSWLSLVGFLSSLVGLFSLTYVQVIPFSIVGGLIGTGALLAAGRWQLNWFSRLLGVAALVLGTTVASFGYWTRTLETHGDVKQARSIAELYLTSLSSKDFEKTYQLAGIASETGIGNHSKDEGENGPRAAKTRLDTDPAHLEIRNRKGESRWRYVGLDGESEMTGGHMYRLRFRDEAQTIPPEYNVFVRKDCEKFKSKETVHWYVDGLLSKKN